MGPEGPVVIALNTVGYARTTSSAIINSAQGRYGSALLDVVSLGGAALASNAKSLEMGTHILPAGQIEFDFVDPAVVGRAKSF